MKKITMYAVKPRVEIMKARYPKGCNIEGLEPALTSDIAEIVLQEVEKAAVEERLRILEITHEHYMGSKNKDVLDAIEAIQQEIHSGHTPPVDREEIVKMMEGMKRSMVESTIDNRRIYEVSGWNAALTECSLLIIETSPKFLKEYLRQRDTRLIEEIKNLILKNSREEYTGYTSFLSVGVDKLIFSLTDLLEKLKDR